MTTKPDALKLARVPIVDRGIGWQADATATLKEQAAEIDRLRTTLAMVADIAHSGGLAQHNDFTALTAIRRLTLDAWNRHGTTDEHRERVHEAGREAVRRSGA